MHRHQPVICKGCGRTVVRKGRTQSFCSKRCRQRSHYAEKIARGAFNRAVSQGTGLPTTPQKKLRSIKGLEAGKTGSSVALPIDLVGGGRHRWPGAVPLDCELVRSILEAELPATTISVATSNSPPLQAIFERIQAAEDSHD